MRLWWLLLIAADCLVIVSGKKTGAPDEVCDVTPPTLEPGHGGSPKDGKSAPYTVTATSDSYSSDKNTITVTIKGNSDNKFKGFAVGVKDSKNDKLIGRWESSKVSHANKCNVATHNDDEDKSSVSLTWKAPKGSSGSVKFIVTIVKEFKTYWTNIPVKV